MKTNLKVRFCLAILLSAPALACAQSTAFTYHGRLSSNGVAVTGAYDMRFTIFDSSGGAGTIAALPPVNNLGVTNGLFTTRLDPGAGVFTGPARWLEIRVRPTGSANFETLSPRQELTSSPYSIRAQTAGTATDVSSGSVVKSLNALKDNVTLAAGANVSISPSGNTLTISSTGGAGGGIWSLNGANTYYNAGSVGVGTISPITRFTVAGAGAFNSPAAAAITLDNTAPTGRRWELHALDDGRFQLADFSGAATRLLVDTAGNVGIGTDSPAHKLTIHYPGFGLEHTDGNVRLGTYVSADGELTDGGWLGTITNHKLHFYVNNGLPSMTVSTAGDVGIGTTTPQFKLDVRGAIRTTALTITGGSDLAEPFSFSCADVAEGSVVIIDDEHPGKLKLSARAYDTRVAGIVSGANGVNPGISLHQEGKLDGSQNVALTGRVYVLADASNGSIRPGDLLTTSDVAGHAMKAADYSRAQGAILGKAMSGLDQGQGMVLVLVTLQ